jgi:hypothetical protein
MNIETTQQTKTQTNWLAIFTATFVWWIIPIVVRLQPQNYKPSLGLAITCLIGVAAAISLCALFRKTRWIILIWIPVFIWTGLGAVMTFGAIAKEPHGGPNAAPLEGVAILISIAVGLLFTVIVILCVVWRPKAYSIPLLILAVGNTAAVTCATRLSERQATRQEMFLHVLDSNGKPLSGASVRYTRYGYGPGGSDVFDGEGGPILSDNYGIAKISSRRMRYEIKGTVTKPGFREVRFDVGMQFNEWDKDRSVWLSTPETEHIAFGSIQTAEPVTLSIYLPSQSDAPDRLHAVKRMQVQADIGQGNQATHVLNLETGKFGNGPEGDLRFDLYSEMEDGRYMRNRLRITGVNGAKVFQVPPTVCLSGALSSYEHMFKVAPQTGYQDETVIQNPGSLPGPMIYVSARDGHLYARMSVDVYGRANEAKARCSVTLFVNPTGNRQLEYPKTSSGLNE